MTHMSMEVVPNGQTESNEWYNTGCITVAGGGHGRGDRRLLASNRRGLKVPPFLNKVYELVDDPNTNAVISWTSNGTSFTVWDHHMFTKNILPAYFRHDNFSSFVYQLNNYGFKKTSWDNWEYENKWFQQGKDYLLVNIKRKNQTPSSMRRNRAAKCSINSDNHEAQVETEKYDHNQTKLEVQKLLKKQEVMESEMGTIKQQIESLFKQQKIVISMFSAFLPQYTHHLDQNASQEGVIKEAEMERKTAEEIKNANQIEHVEADYNTSQQNNLFFCDDPGNLVENRENCSLLEKLMEIDENHDESQGELASRHCNIVMELEDLMTQAELGGYIEYMSQLEFQETKPAI